MSNEGACYMPPIVTQKTFHVFNRLSNGREVAEEINEVQARTRVEGGRDVYTPRRANAHTLAIAIFQTEPLEPTPHQAHHFGHFQEDGAKHKYNEQAKEVSWDKTSNGTSGHIFF